MAVRVGDCSLVQRLEPGDRVGPESTGVFLARDDRNECWVVVDVRREESLQLPDEELDAELAGQPGLRVPLRRAHDRARGLVALVEPLEVRRSLGSVPELAPATAAVLFGRLVADLADALAGPVCLTPLTGRDLVLVERDGEVRLELSTGRAKRLAGTAGAHRNLAAVVAMLPGQTSGSPPGQAAASTAAVPSTPSPVEGCLTRWPELVRGWRVAADQGALDPRELAAGLRQYASQRAAEVATVRLPPLPRLPGEELRSARRVAVARTGARRAIGPLEVVVGAVGLAAAVGFGVVVSHSGAEAQDPATRHTAAPTARVTPTAVPTQPPPADQPVVGQPCAFYDVGVTDRSGSAVLRCAQQEDGTYRWQNRP